MNDEWFVIYNNNDDYNNNVQNNRLQ